MPAAASSTRCSTAGRRSGAGAGDHVTVTDSHHPALLRNTIIGILHLHRIPNIAAQLRSCHRDPYQLPLRLLGLTTPQVPLTRNPAVT
jgi:hypothetical protein